MSKRIQKTKEHWDAEAVKHKNPLSTMLDIILNDLEIENIAKYLSNGKKILDAGCGTGVSLVRLARKVKSNFVGCDYAEKTIWRANQLLKKEKRIVRKKVSFVVGDVLNLPFKDEIFNIVMTDRVLINLISLKSHVAAAREICRVLKKGGIYVGCESMQESAKNLNQLRQAVGLAPLRPRWHNFFINQEKFLKGTRRFFQVKKIDNFASTYFLASRVFNAELAGMKGREPSFKHPLNMIGARLPPIGDYGLLKILVLIKK